MSDIQNAYPGFQRNSPLTIDASHIVGLSSQSSLSPATKVVATAASGFVADYYTAGSQDDVKIQTAIDAVNILGGGIVYLRAGTYIVSGRVTPKSNVRLMGEGRDNTIIVGGVASDWNFYQTDVISDFWITDLTIDAQNATAASIYSLFSATRCGAERVYFKNVAANGWMVRVGVANGVTDGILNIDNKFIDCDFDTHNGSLEMFLAFNTRNLQLVRPTFRHNGAGPCLGLWQKCYNTKIIDPYFQDNQGNCIYYSITVEDTTIQNPHMKNCGSGIGGANISDNGAFGLTQAQNLKIINPVFIGGANSTNAAAIQLGAVNNVSIILPHIEQAQIGIIINSGNNGANATATNWEIIGGEIRNNNASANIHLLHPGILLSGIGGSLNGKILDVQLYDDQVTKNQRYPIVFDGAFTWDAISITNNRLTADTVNSGTSIALGDGATLGANVEIFENQDFSGTNPVQRITGGINILPAADSTAVLKVTNAANTRTYLAVDTVGGFVAIRQDGSGGDVLDFGGGSSRVNANNGNLSLRSGFTGKSFSLLDSNSAVKLSTLLDSGKTFVGGATSPTALLHLAAGTATANTAPLKFTSGVNLTTAESGAMEYDGTNLFFTRSGTTREGVLTESAVNTVNPTAPNRTITVNIGGTTYYLAAKTTND